MTGDGDGFSQGPGGLNAGSEPLQHAVSGDVGVDDGGDASPPRNAWPGRSAVTSDHHRPNPARPLVAVLGIDANPQSARGNAGQASVTSCGLRCAAVPDDHSRQGQGPGMPRSSLASRMPPPSWAGMSIAAMIPSMDATVLWHPGERPVKIDDVQQLPPLILPEAGGGGGIGGIDRVALASAPARGAHTGRF